MKGTLKHIIFLNDQSHTFSMMNWNAEHDHTINHTLPEQQFSR